MNSSFNPYAAPNALPPENARAAGQGQPAPWTPGEVIGVAWERFKPAWVVLIVAIIIMNVSVQALSFGTTFGVKMAGLDKTVAGTAITLASMIALSAVGAFFLVGLLRIFLDTARGKPPQLGTLFLGGDHWLAMVGLYFLMWVPMGPLSGRDPAYR
jgi:hypothetical protein